jgi:signal transduction histidine kinase
VTGWEDARVGAPLSEATLRRLLDAGRALVRHLELEPILDELLGVAADVTGAQYVALGILNEERTGLSQFLTRGVDPETHRRIGDLPRGRGVLGVLIQDPQPLRLAEVGRHPESYGFPAGHPPMHTFLGVPLVIRTSVWGNLYLTEKAGGVEFTLEDEEAVVVLAGWAAIAIENARLYESVQGQRDELRRAVGGLAATTAIAKAVGSETDLDRVLELIVKRGRALVDAHAVLLLLREDGAESVIAASAGTVGGAEPGQHVDVEPAALAARVGLDTAVPGSVVLVDLEYRQETLGVLVALRDGTPFDEEEERLLSAFAASAATAVANARTVARDQLRKSLAAAEAERRRWARELHDETLQGLAGLQVLLSSALRRPESDALAGAVREATGQLETEIANLRTLITELRPAALDELGLAPALESLTSRLGAVEGLDVSLELDLGAERLPAELETTVYRVVQEALSNVAKHARAESVAVRVARANGAVDVQVSDDGRGFDPGAPADGFGLVGMRERTGLAGGELRLESSSAGTVVRARFPVP